MDKKGVSPVVATVLLLVLTIIIAGVIFSVVIPFVRDKLTESKSCLDVFEGAEFAESRFNCYNATSGETSFSVKINKGKISGVRVGLIDSNGNSDVYDLPGEGDNANIRMAGGSFGDPLTFPATGGQRTYFARGVYNKAEISPITETGEICALGDVIEFEMC